MILFQVKDGSIYSMAPGDSLHFEYMTLGQNAEGHWFEMYLVTGNISIRLIRLYPDDNPDEFQLRLIACLQAGRQDHTLLVDLEGLRTLAKGKG